jgi:exopolysaccharide biosynthesis polyprenyl glycosylphosphotransferase
VSFETSPHARTRTLFAGWPVILGLTDFAMLVVVAMLSRGVPPVLLVVMIVAVESGLIASGMYATRLRVEALDRAPLTVAMVTLGAMIVVSLDFMVLHIAVAPTDIFRLWYGAAAAVLIGRLAISPLYRIVLRQAPKRRALIIGSGIAAILVAEKVEHHPELDLDITGFVDDGPRKSVRGRPEPLLGDLRDLDKVIRREAIEVVVMGYTHDRTETILSALSRVEPGVEILMMPRYFQFVSAGMRVDDLAGMPLLRLRRREPAMWEQVSKRAEDLIIGGVASLIVMPILPLIALAIKLDSSGPVLFSQERIGKNGRAFSLYKFRSMTECTSGDDASANGARTGQVARAIGSTAEDPRLKDKPVWRVTRVGRFLRTTSLDELPQLFNVLRGDMSLVGPRPPLGEEVAQYEEWQKKRLAVSPGITGMWQVNGRSDLPFDEMVWLDFAYIDSWSLWLDLRILLQTIPAVLSRRGAY